MQKLACLSNQYQLHEVVSSPICPSLYIYLPLRRRVLSPSALLPQLPLFISSSLLFTDKYLFDLHHNFPFTSNLYSVSQPPANSRFSSNCPKSTHILNHPQLPPLPYGLPLHLTPSMNSSPCVSSFSPTGRASVSLHVLLPLLVVAPLTGGWI